MGQQPNIPPDDDAGRPEPLQAAFLVRCWKHQQTWRFSLEDITTRRRRSYATPAALLEGILSELANLDEHD